LSKKWTIPVICELNKNTVLRYNQLQRNLEGISNVVLAQTLRNLENNDIVLRTQYNEIPPKVEYSLTKKGQIILPVLYTFSHDDLDTDDSSAYSCEENCHILMPDHRNIIKDLDDIYDKTLDNLQNSSIHSIDKIRHIFEAGLDHISKIGKDKMRRMSVELLRNQLLIEFSTEPTRQLYKVLDKLINEARDKDEIIQFMSNTELLSTWTGFIRGIDQNWQVSSENYDLVTENKIMLTWFFDNFKKKPK